MKYECNQEKIKWNMKRSANKLRFKFQNKVFIKKFY